VNKPVPPACESVATTFLSAPNDTLLSFNFNQSLAAAQMEQEVAYAKQHFASPCMAELVSSVATELQGPSKSTQTSAAANGTAAPKLSRWIQDGIFEYAFSVNSTTRLKSWYQQPAGRGAVDGSSKDTEPPTLILDERSLRASYNWTAQENNYHPTVRAFSPDRAGTLFAFIVSRNGSVDFRNQTRQGTSQVLHDLWIRDASGSSILVATDTIGWSGLQWLGSSLFYVGATPNQDLLTACNETTESRMRREFRRVTVSASGGGGGPSIVSSAVVLNPEDSSAYLGIKLTHSGEYLLLSARNFRRSSIHIISAHNTTAAPVLMASMRVPGGVLSLEHSKKGDMFYMLAAERLPPKMPRADSHASIDEQTLEPIAAVSLRVMSASGLAKSNSDSKSRNTAGECAGLPEASLPPQCTLVLNHPWSIVPGTSFKLDANSVQRMTLLDSHLVLWQRSQIRYASLHFETTTDARLPNATDSAASALKFRVASPRKNGSEKPRSGIRKVPYMISPPQICHMAMIHTAHESQFLLGEFAGEQTRVPIQVYSALMPSRPFSVDLATGAVSPTSADPSEDGGSSSEDFIEEERTIPMSSRDVSVRVSLAFPSTVTGQDAVDSETSSPSQEADSADNGGHAPGQRRAAPGGSSLRDFHYPKFAVFVAVESTSHGSSLWQLDASSSQKSWGYKSRATGAVPSAQSLTRLFLRHGMGIAYISVPPATNFENGTWTAWEDFQEAVGKLRAIGFGVSSCAIAGGTVAAHGWITSETGCQAAWIEVSQMSTFLLFCSSFLLHLEAGLNDLFSSPSWIQNPMVDVLPLLSNSSQSWTHHARPRYGNPHNAEEQKSMLRWDPYAYALRACRKKDGQPMAEFHKRKSMDALVSVDSPLNVPALKLVTQMRGCGLAEDDGDDATIILNVARGNQSLDVASKVAFIIDCIISRTVSELDQSEWIEMNTEQNPHGIIPLFSTLSSTESRSADAIFRASLSSSSQSHSPGCART
jgi:hypothetical protein